MGQRVLIDLFQVAVLVVAVNLENAVEPTQRRKGAKTQVIRLLDTTTYRVSHLDLSFLAISLFLAPFALFRGRDGET